MKKLTTLFVAIALSIVMLFAVATTASAGEFTDVPEGSWYEEAVTWAKDNVITTGTSDTTFSPDMVCDRSQVVTFLWRTFNSPAPGNSVTAFTDIVTSDWYYRAVLWAVEKGITTGTSATTFAPTMQCDRAQIVTFLWRAMGSPEPAGANTFPDVPAGAYYEKAVAWAVENDITTGTGNGNFSPSMSCTRAQVVTFLMRAAIASGYESEDARVYLNVEGVDLGNRYIPLGQELTFKGTISGNATAPYTITILDIDEGDNIGRIDQFTVNGKEFEWKHTFTEEDYGTNGTIRLDFTVESSGGKTGYHLDPIEIYKYTPMFIATQPASTLNLMYLSGSFRNVLSVYPEGGTGNYSYKWQVKMPGDTDFRDLTEDDKSTVDKKFAFVEDGIGFSNFGLSFDRKAGEGCAAPVKEGFYVRCVVVDENGDIRTSDESYVYCDMYVVEAPKDVTGAVDTNYYTFKCNVAYGAEAKKTFVWEYYNTSTRKWTAIASHDIVSEQINSTGTISTITTEFLNDCSKVRCKVTDAFNNVIYSECNWSSKNGN